MKCRGPHNGVAVSDFGNLKEGEKMYIDNPFIEGTAVDTSSAFGLLEFPPAETLHRLEDELEQWKLNEEPIVFRTADRHWELTEVLCCQRDLDHVDTWWIWGVVLIPGSDMEVFVLCSPGSAWNGFLATFTDLIDTRGL